MGVAVLALEQELYGDTQPNEAEISAAIDALEKLVND
jgi:hypothetical protein